TALLRLLPEGLVGGIVDELAVDLRGDADAGKAQLLGAAGELLQMILAAQRMDMRRADDAAGIVALGLLRLVVDEARALEVGAHAGSRGEEGGVDPRQVHHGDMLVEIVEQPVRGVAGGASLVIGEDAAVAELLLEELARRPMVLEIDDHLGSSPARLLRG